MQASCHPQDPDCVPWLLASAWPSAGYCSYVKSGSVPGRSLVLQINKTKMTRQVLMGSSAGGSCFDVQRGQSTKLFDVQIKRTASLGEQESPRQILDVSIFIVGKHELLGSLFPPTGIR